MFFKAKELSIINYSLQTTSVIAVDGKQMARTFPVNQLKTAISIFDKIKSLTENDVFIDGEVEFSTEEKTLILSLLDREWRIEDGVVKISTEKKLS